MKKLELVQIIKTYVAKQIDKIEIPAIDIAEVAEKAALLIPKPKDGENGKDGKDGVGEKGEKGDKGDSVDAEQIKTSIAADFERRFSEMTLSWERQARDTFEKAVDKMPIPKDGENGKDALPLEDIEITQDGRNVTLKLGPVERTIKLDTVLDKGVWKDEVYEKGDAVTYGGSLWIAQSDEQEGAPGTCKSWRLAVKKGRDGKDLRDSASKHDKSKGLKL